MASEQEKFDSRKEVVAVALAGLAVAIARAGRSVAAASEPDEVGEILKTLEAEMERTFGVVQTQLDRVDGAEEEEMKLP